MATTSEPVGETPEEMPPPMVDPEAETADDLPIARRPRRRERERERAGTVRLQPFKDLDTAEAATLVDWYTTLGAGGSEYKVAVYRNKPLQYRGKSCAGHLYTYESELPDEDRVKDDFGGGEYTLKVLRMNGKGSFVIFKTKSVKIAGDPKLPDLDEPSKAAEAPSIDKGIIGMAFESLRDQAKDAREREREARDRREPVATRPALADFDYVVKPYADQLDALRDQNQMLAKQIADMQKTPADPFKDKILEKFVDGDSARVAAMRSQHESEIRVLKENAREDEKRAESRHERAMDAMRASHEREVSNMKSGYDNQLAIMKMSQETVTRSLESEVKKLERDLADARKELSELRSKKDQSILEKAKELKEVKNLIGAGDDEGEEKSTIERVMDAALGSSFATKIAERIGGAPAPQQQAPQEPPVGQPFQGPDGNWYARRPDGNYQRLRPPKRRRPVVAAAPPGGAPPEGAEGAPAEAPPPPVNLSPEVVQMAVSYLSQAYTNGIEPGTVAASVRNMVPEDVLRLIRARGVEFFLDSVAKIESSSPLASQGGRNFARKVAKALVGDV